MNAVDICCGIRVRHWGAGKPGTVIRTATRTFDPESIITVELDDGGVVEAQPHELSAVPPRAAAVTVSYLACGKTKYAVLAPADHPMKGLPGLRVSHLPLFREGLLAQGDGTKILKRGLTATGAERVANRANAVALAVRRLG